MPCSWRPRASEPGPASSAAYRAPRLVRVLAVAELHDALEREREPLREASPRAPSSARSPRRTPPCARRPRRRARAASRRSARRRSRNSASTSSYRAGSTTIPTPVWFFADARTSVGPPMSICSTTSGQSRPFATVSRNGYRFTTTRSIGSIPASASCRRCSGSSRLARIPPWIRGCSVFTRPSSISGKPGDLGDRRRRDAVLGEVAAGRVGGDDRDAELRKARAEIRRGPSRSETETSARFTGIRSATCSILTVGAATPSAR